MDLSDPHQIIGNRCIEVAETNSTNTMLALLDQEASLPEGTVLFAGHQTSGRGQFSKSWQSEPDQNILASILLKPKSFPTDRLFEINIAVTLGLFDLLDKHFPGRVKIKWSNDILVEDKKIAGVLIENQVGATYLTRTIAGIGFNVNQENFGTELPFATSLKLLTGEHQDIFEWKNGLLTSINYFYHRMLQGWSEMDRKLYIKNLYGFGEWKTWISGDADFEGMITGIDTMGRLCMKTKQDHSSYWNPGEIIPQAFNNINRKF